MQITRLSDTRWKVCHGRATYYVKQIRPQSEDYDAWNETGERSVWLVDDGEDTARVEPSTDCPEAAVVAFLNRCRTGVPVPPGILPFGSTP